MDCISAYFPIVTELQKNFLKVIVLLNVSSHTSLSLSIWNIINFNDVVNGIGNFSNDPKRRMENYIKSIAIYGKQLC